MAYTITDGGVRIATTIWTTVKFDFLDYEIDIPHFEPKSEADIIIGIENREITERNKLDAENTNINDLII